MPLYATEWNQTIVVWLTCACTHWTPSPLSFIFVHSCRLWKPTWHPRTVTGSMPMRWGQTQTRTNTEENSLLKVCLSSVFILCRVSGKLSFYSVFHYCPCLMGSVHLFFSVAPPVTLTSSDPNCTNEEFDEFADHFLLLMVDINAITHSDLFIFLDI